jgi:hypothetical protein
MAADPAGQPARLDRGIRTADEGHDPGIPGEVSAVRGVARHSLRGEGTRRGEDAKGQQQDRPEGDHPRPALLSHHDPPSPMDRRPNYRPRSVSLPRDARKWWLEVFGAVEHTTLVLPHPRRRSVSGAT